MTSVLIRRRIFFVNTLHNQDNTITEFGSFTWNTFHSGWPMSEMDHVIVFIRAIMKLRILLGILHKTMVL